MRSTITLNYSWPCTKHFQVSFISPLLNWDKETKELHKTLIKPDLSFFFFFFSLNLTDTSVFFFLQALSCKKKLFEKRDKFPRNLCPWKGSSSFVAWIKVVRSLQNAAFFFLQQISIFQWFWENSPFCIKSLWATKYFCWEGRKSLYLENFKCKINGKELHTLS